MRVVSLDQKIDKSLEAWYIPRHGIYHPYKPEKNRIASDCSAKFRGVSFNSMLYRGPDLTNTLVGVLTRLWEDRIAVMAGIESMFEFQTAHHRLPLIAVSGLKD